MDKFIGQKLVAVLSSFLGNNISAIISAVAYQIQLDIMDPMITITDFKKNLNEPIFLYSFVHHLETISGVYNIINLSAIYN